MFEPNLSRLQPMSKRYSTCRRHYLDQALADFAFAGRILDVGGKKLSKRGQFRPPLLRVQSWEYLNNDASTEPDYCCSAEQMPLDNACIDQVLMTEVLEHLPDPVAVLKECHRVLKGGGQLIATMPFLYPIHADPHDYQRWTPDKIQLVLLGIGFSEIEIKPMGSLFAVLYDLLFVSLGLASKDSQSLKNRLVRKALDQLLFKPFLWLDSRYAYKSRHITTGFWIEASACK